MASRDGPNKKQAEQPLPGLLIYGSNSEVSEAKGIQSQVCEINMFLPQEDEGYQQAPEPALAVGWSFIQGRGHCFHRPARPRPWPCYRSGPCDVEVTAVTQFL